MRTLIKNGEVHDGEHSVGLCNVLIEGEKIADIGISNEMTADQVIDATGCIVCPGFVDPQNMTFQIEDLNGNEGINLTSQGVTTAIIGNCGNSGVWNSPEMFIHQIGFLESMNLGINIGCLVGHNSLRRFVMSEGERTASADELDRMTYLLEKSLDHGALGMSTGLMYAPGLFADEAELKALVSIVGKNYKVYATHMRDEGDLVVEATTEALDLAKYGNAKLVISHLKINGKRNWGKSSELIELIEKRKNGQEVYLDFYPYTATSTVLNFIVLPNIMKRIGGDFSQLQYNEEDEKSMEKRGRHTLCSNGWEDVIVVTSRISEILGKSIADIAGDGNAYRIFIDIIRRDPATRAVFRNIASEEEMHIIARLPYAMAATDGYIYPKNSKAATHPRNYGALARVISNYVVSNSVYSIDDFIHKQTCLPARAFNLKQRGMLKRGNYADVIVFRSDEVKDCASYEYPFLLSQGMRYVFVNGSLVLKDNDTVGTFPGRLIK